MDLSPLLMKVHTSPLLTESERAYWAQNLPKMTPEQVQKLEGILTEAEGMSWSEEMQNYLMIVNKATVALT